MDGEKTSSIPADWKLAVPRDWAQVDRTPSVRAQVPRTQSDRTGLAHPAPRQLSGVAWLPVWLFACLFLAALPPQAAAQRWTFATLGEAAGLTNPNVTGMVEDKNGSLWVATQHGVFEADGATFHREAAFDAGNTGLAMSVAADAHGRIWAATSGSLEYVDTNEKSPRTAHAFAELPPGFGEAQGVVLLALPQDPEAMYLLKGGELHRIGSVDGGRTWHVAPAFSSALRLSYPQLTHLSSLAAGAGGTLWAGCGISLCEINRDRSAVRTWGVAEGVGADRWTRLLLARSGALWARGTHGVSVLAPGAGHFTSLGKPPAGTYLDTQSTSLVEDATGRVLLNLSRGIARIDGRKGEAITPARGLPQDEIDLLFFSRAGDLWLAPSGHGLSRWLGYGNWENWTVDEGLSTNVVWAAQPDAHHRLWITTEIGLDVLDKSTGAIHPQTRGFPYHRLEDAKVDSKGHVWTGDALGRVVDFDPATAPVRSGRNSVPSHGSFSIASSGFGSALGMGSTTSISKVTIEP